MALDSRNNVNLYEKGRNTAYESYSFLVEDNIVVPKRAPGKLLQTSRTRTGESICLIDFGEGIVVPFILMEEQNRAKKQIEAGKKAYRLNESRRAPLLYLDTTDLLPKAQN